MGFIKKTFTTGEDDTELYKLIRNLFVEKKTDEEKKEIIYEKLEEINNLLTEDSFFKDPIHRSELIINYHVAISKSLLQYGAISREDFVEMAGKVNKDILSVVDDDKSKKSDKKIKWWNSLPNMED